MKRILAWTLLAALLLSGCGSKLIPSKDAANKAPAPEVQTNAPAAETTAEAATEATTEPTTVPTTEPEVYYDPLNGEILDAPFDGRIYASSVANTNDASIPHVSLYQADIVMEMFVNNSVVRCLALFSDFSDVTAIGSTRSTRMMFNDIVQHYNAILAHAGGTGRVIRDANNRGITHFNVDSLMRQGEELAAGTAYREKGYPKVKYGEYNLFTKGPGVMAYAEAQGIQLNGMPETDYGLRFADDGTPVDGEDAGSISITITYNDSKKETIMQYDPEYGRYVYHQYGRMMKDMMTEVPEDFVNVVVMYTNITRQNEYHVADFVAGGTGYFACGGKIIPITWTCDGDTAPFRFFTEDGEPLNFGRGNTYIAITTPGSAVTWSAAESDGETAE